MRQNVAFYGNGLIVTWLSVVIRKKESDNNAVSFSFP